MHNHTRLPRPVITPRGRHRPQMAFNLYQDPAGNLVVKTRAVAVEVAALAVIGLIPPGQEIRSSLSDALGISQMDKVVKRLQRLNAISNRISCLVVNCSDALV